MNEIKILEALKCTQSQNVTCKNCDYAIFMKDGLLDYCDNEKLHADAAKLIKKQQAEIEQLKQEKRERANPQPLTIDELKQMDNFEWVWIETLGIKERSAYYCKSHDFTSKAFACSYPGVGYGFNFSEYGNTWLAYEHNPKEHADEE